MAKTQRYLASGPHDLLNSCDVLLKLEDGTELPAHSQVLARCMPVFSGMVDGGPLLQASPSNVVSVPFGDCSSEEAGRFLSAVYSFRAHEHIDEHSALSIARLSHKYGVEDLVKLCDDALAEKAGIYSKGESLPIYLKNLEMDVEGFLYTMKCATLYGMPKLLACCEYYIALSSSGLQPTTNAVALRVRCLSEPLLRRSSSRIAEGFCIAFQGLAEHASRRQPCKCACCLGRNDPGYTSCNCHIAATPKEKLSGFLPGPKAFLKMAGAEKY